MFAPLASIPLLVALGASAPPSPPSDPLLAELAERRAALRARLGPGTVALVLGAEDDDEFQQKPAFAYLAGALQADAVLLLEPGNAERPETLFLPARDRSRERWTGTALGPGDVHPDTGEPDAERRETMTGTGVGAVRPLEQLDRELARALGSDRTLVIDAPPAAAGKPASPELELVRSLRERRAALEVKPLAEHLKPLRMVKSAREIAAIRRACEVTMAAHRELAADLVPGRREYETKALLEYVFKRSGASGLAFASVVGSGINSTVLHYRGDRREMKAGDLVVVDVGAAWDGYAADVTRTYPVSGRFEPEQRRVYDTVLAAQEAALARVKAGARLRSDVHAAAKKVIDGAGFEGRFLHSTSHHVGLEVHDPGERDGELKAGMVITVEPGIYLPDQALGVRIEDVVVVTRDGYELLTAALPRKAEEVEALMAARSAVANPMPASSSK